ncbi:hypothetical protein H310_13671 [Aphanomyces invadans]|uniref:FAM192A/Fyv6 N-terminal domain-containing protein n=1 Tax=Aphanomyces invadans TaxID=157072 RepID=A0A024TCV4_9STRA|nr:hypothetical protein H310_13671 [Aphanomyces invadans]ETV91844.1 hypothetical protein H310_13671 [Aphanomyces invadans]|eukprot:XP_008879481.1 hypothetical protein H310_13671 [Aphanomyces invadans]
MTTASNSVAAKFPSQAKEVGETTEVSRPRSKPIAGFVSTSVLSSSDGLFGDNVEEVRITDRPESSADKVDYRPLYERLKEQKNARDADWKEKNNPFAPPKGLDDEEIDFLHTLESDQKKIQDEISRHHEEELAHFALLKREINQSKKPPAANSVPIAAASVNRTELPLEKKSIKVAARAKVKKSKQGGHDSQGTSKKQKTAAPVASLVAAYSDDDDNCSSDT